MMPSCVTTLEANYSYSGLDELTDAQLKNKLQTDLQRCDEVTGQKQRGDVRLIASDNPSSEARHRYCMERKKWAIQYDEQH